MQLVEIVQQVNALKAEIDALRPIDYEQEQRIMQKFRLEWNYQVIGKFSINGSTFRAPDMEQQLLIAGYHKTDSAEEIDAMIYSIVQEVYVRVEQMAESANQSKK